MKQIILITFLLIAFFLCTCDEKREFNNPVASGVEIPAPEGFQAAQEGEWIKLTWNKNNMITSGWKLERKTGGDTFGEIAHLRDAALLTYTDTTITTDVAYQYRLRGYSDENASLYTEPIVFTSQFSPPTELTATPISDQLMRLTWNDNSIFESGFILERKTGLDAFAEIKNLPANLTAVTDSGLIYGAEFHYRIKAYTINNQSAYSNIVRQSTIFPAPTGLVAAAISDSEIKLSWTDNCTYEAGYRIERSGDGSNYTQVGEVQANLTEYTDSGLEYGKDYHYRVFAFTEKNQSAYSNVVTKSTVFPAPGGLTATAISDSEIRLTWTDNCAYESGYRIERSGDGSNYTQVGEVLANVTEYTDSGLEYGKDYHYRVFAFTEKNQSGFSNVVSQTIIIPAPTGLVATAISDSEIKLSWTDNCVYETGYRIERSGDGSNYTQVGELQANITEYTDSGLEYGKDYHYRVFAFTEKNQSAYSNVVTKSTVFPAPGGLTATAISDSEIRLTWTDNCAYESGYRIERSGDGSSYIQVGEVQANITEYTDPGLEYGKDYYYRVFAFTEKNQSAYSNVVIKSTVFPAPGGLTAAAISDSEIRLSWTDNCAYESGYRIERSGDGSNYTQVGEVQANVTEYTDSGLEYGKDYHYRVFAFTEKNQSGFSNVVSQTIIIPAPGGLTATAISDSQIRLTWTDNCTYEAGYRIERSEDGSNYAQVGEVAANIVEYMDGHLVYGSEYHYRVYAYTVNNQSAYSNIVIQSTIFPSPTGLVATAISDSEIKLSWTDNCTYEAGYRIERSEDGLNYVQVGEVTANIVEYIDGNLVYGTEYHYRVYAYTTNNQSGFSNVVNQSTVFPAPSSLTAEAISDSEIKLSWTDNCTYEAGYRIERSEDGTTFSQVGEVSSDVTEFTDSNLIYGKEYSYRVYAYTVNNQSSYSNIVIQSTIFPAPTGLTAEASSASEIRLSWTDNCTFESGYLVEKDEASGFMQIAQVAANSINYTDNNALWDREQSYRVWAFTTTNESDYSNEAALNPAEGAAPTNLELTEYLDSIQLTWQDNCSFEDGFRIERSDDGGAWQQVADLPANSADYSDSALNPESNYTYRVYAYVGINISLFSNEVNRETRIGTVTDIDGNVYNTIRIGNQVWMAENLKVSRYRNGEAIPNVTDDGQWVNLSTGARCAYNNDNDNVTTYGLLYNWYAVNDSRNLAPEGWHIPTDDEWKELEMYLGMSQSEADGTGGRGSPVGNKLKATSGWSSNGNGSNESSFTALPGGYRSPTDGSWGGIGGFGYWWSSTESISSMAWDRILYYYLSDVHRYQGHNLHGFSVRCVRD